MFSFSKSALIATENDKFCKDILMHFILYSFKHLNVLSVLSVVINSKLNQRRKL